jgi:hypothetical protein
MPAFGHPTDIHPDTTDSCEQSHTSAQNSPSAVHHFFATPPKRLLIALVNCSPAPGGKSSIYGQLTLGQAHVGRLQSGHEWFPLLNKLRVR